MKNIIRISLLVTSLYLLVGCIPVEEQQETDSDDTTASDTSSDTTADDASSDDQSTDETPASNAEFEESAEDTSQEQEDSAARAVSDDVVDPPETVLIESIDDVTRVTWESVDDAEYYNIYAGQGDDAFVHVHSVIATEVKEYYLQEGNEYTGLYITVVRNEQESIPSSIVFLSPSSTISSEESVVF